MNGAQCVKMQPTLKPPRRPFRVSWLDISVLVGIVAAFSFLGLNVLGNMESSGVHPGFGFLRQQSGFDMSESLISYGSDDTYFRAIVAGLINTLFVTAATMAVACAVGMAVGLLSVSSSPIARVLALAYVELFRNLPKILVLLVIFIVAVTGLPSVRQAIQFGPFMISNRAIYFPWIAPGPHNIVWLSLLILVFAVFFAGLWITRANRFQSLSGVGGAASAVLLSLPILTVIAIVSLQGPPLAISWPQLEGFAIRGGAGLSIQFCVVTLALGLYHGAQIAEVLRGGIEAIPKGQIEAAASLGLKSGQVTRLIVIPQVLRLVIPPLNNQFANLLKNTSISIAVGYSDLMSVASTTINQTFRPLEVMVVTMAIYLTLCLVLTAALNHWSETIRSREGRAGR